MYNQEARRERPVALSTEQSSTIRMANPEVVRNVGLMQGEFAKFLSDQEGQNYGKTFANYYYKGPFGGEDGGGSESTNTGAA
jgi:hypothetical protein